MAYEYPYILTDSVTLSANSTGTAELSMGETEEFEAHEIFFSSTGSFEVTSIIDSASLPYTNADSNNPLPSTLFTTSNEQKSDIGKFPIPLRIAPNNKIKVGLKDTSGSSNTVRVFLRGVRRVR